MLLALNVLSKVVPVGNLLFVVREGHHCQCLSVLVARTNVGTVATTNAIEHAHLNAEVHASHWLGNFHFECCILKALHFFLVENERADTSVRTNVGTLVTLNTVLGSPFGVEGLNAAFFESCGTIRHRTVYHVVAHEVGYFEQVARLSVDWAYNLLDVCRYIFFGCNSIIG